MLQNKIKPYGSQRHQEAVHESDVHFHNQHFKFEIPPFLSVNGQQYLLVFGNKKPLILHIIEKVFYRQVAINYWLGQGLIDICFRDYRQQLKHDCGNSEDDDVEWPSSCNQWKVGHEFGKGTSPKSLKIESGVWICSFASHMTKSHCKVG